MKPSHQKPRRSPRHPDGIGVPVEVDRVTFESNQLVPEKFVQEHSIISRRDSGAKLAEKFVHGVLAKLFPDKIQDLPLVLVSRSKTAWADYVNGSMPPTIVVSSAVFDQAAQKNSYDFLVAHLSLAMQRMLLRQEYGVSASYLERSGAFHEKALQRLLTAGFNPRAARMMFLEQAQVSMAQLSPFAEELLGQQPIGARALPIVEAVLITIYGQTGGLRSSATPLPESEIVQRLVEECHDSHVERFLGRSTFYRAGPGERINIVADLLSNQDIRWDTAEVGAMVDAIDYIHSGSASETRAAEAQSRARLSYEGLGRVQRSGVQQIFAAIVAFGTHGYSDGFNQLFEIACGTFAVKDRAILREISPELFELIEARDAFVTSSKFDIVTASKRLKSAIEDCTLARSAASKVLEHFSPAKFPLSKVPGARVPWNTHIEVALSSDSNDRDLVRGLLESFEIFDWRLYRQSGDELAKRVYCADPGMYLNGVDGAAFSELKISEEGTLSKDAPTNEQRLADSVVQYIQGVIEGNDKPQLDSVLADSMLVQTFAEAICGYCCLSSNESMESVVRGQRPPRQKTLAGPLFHTIRFDRLLEDPVRYRQLFARIFFEDAFQEALVRYLESHPPQPDVSKKLAKLLEVLTSDEFGGAFCNPAYDCDGKTPPFFEYLAFKAPGLPFELRWSALLRSGYLDDEIFVEDSSGETCHLVACTLRAVLTKYGYTVDKDGPKTFAQLGLWAKDRAIQLLPDSSFYFALETRLLVQNDQSEADVADLLAVAARINPLRLRQRMTLDEVEATLETDSLSRLPLEDRVASWKLLYERDLFSSVADSRKALEEIVVAIDKIANPGDKRALIETLLFTSSEKTIRFPEIVQKLIQVWCGAFKEQITGESSNDEAVENDRRGDTTQKAVAEAQRIGGSAHPRYVTKWLDMLARGSELQVEAAQKLRHQSDLAEAKLSLKAGRFENQYEELRILVQNRTLRVALAHFLFNPVSQGSLNTLSSAVWSQAYSERMGSDSINRIFFNQKDFERFADQFHTTFWNDSQQGLIVRILELLIPITGSNDEGQLVGGELGRQNAELESIRTICGLYANFLGPNYTNDFKKYLMPWLRQGESLESIVRLVGLIAAFRPVMLGARDPIVGFEALCEWLGPVFVFGFQRTPLLLDHDKKLAAAIETCSARAKSSVAPPLHWDGTELVDETVPPVERYELFDHVRGIEGAGKIWLSFGCVHEAFGERILQIQRPYCSELIDSNTITAKNLAHTAAGLPGGTAISYLLNGAGAACKQEIDIGLSQKQFEHARRCMHARTMAITLDRETRGFDTSTPEHLAAGIGANGYAYRCMTRLPGTPFVRWVRHADEKEARYAAAGFYVFGILMIARAQCNRDPHEGNSMVFGRENRTRVDTLGLIDFGLLELDAQYARIDEHEKLGVTLARAGTNMAKRNVGLAISDACRGTKYSYGDSLTMSGAGLKGFELFLSPQEREKLFACAMRYAYPEVAQPYYDELRRLGDSGARLLSLQDDEMMLLKEPAAGF